MITTKRKINISTIIHFVLIVFISFSTTKALCQEEDSLRTARLIKQTNDLFLRPYAQGIFLSPFELRQHHRDQTIKNIEWVKAFDLYRETSSKTDTIPFVVKDNQTVILKPDERFNSWTYSYRDDGRIHKIFRGRHLDDLFVIDDDRFLIQHGFGGELKKAKRKGKLFEWYNVRNDQLEYVISYDERNRVSNIKTMGHYFGPGVECQVEVYAWEEKRIIVKNTLMKFKNGSTDTTFLKFAYDQLGLIQSISQRKGGQVDWSTTQVETNIEYLKNKHLNITISGAGNLLFSITFDHYDNIIEINTPANRKRVNIKYRKRRRWN